MFLKQYVYIPNEIFFTPSSNIRGFTAESLVCPWSYVISFGDVCCKLLNLNKTITTNSRQNTKNRLNRNIFSSQAFHLMIPCGCVIS